jgi:uncharacterized protein (UPF0332 family)
MMKETKMASSEIQLYLNRARQDLQATQVNLEQGFYDVAVSRAYYAVFYAANALLVSKGITRSRHSGVLSAFSEHFVKPGLVETEYAKILGQAFDSRLDSDYDVTFTAERTLAEVLLQDAWHFVDRVEQYLRQVGAL